MAYIVVKMKYKNNVSVGFCLSWDRSEAKPVKLWEDLENYFQ